MRNVLCSPGDLLFYFDAPNEVTRLIQFGEELETHSDEPLPYHCAIALGPDFKIEANGKHVAIAPIDYGKFVVCRPPYEARRLAKSLMWARKQEGKLYGMFGIVDQILRDASGGHLHFPRFLIVWLNKLMPYCSTFLAAFATRTGAVDIPPYPPPSPGTDWIALRQYILLG